jgi:hypothetical protein
MVISTGVGMAGVSSISQTRSMSVLEPCSYACHAQIFTGLSLNSDKECSGASDTLCEVTELGLEEIEVGKPKIDERDV